MFFCVCYFSGRKKLQCNLSKTCLRSSPSFFCSRWDWVDQRRVPISSFKEDRQIAICTKVCTKLWGHFQLTWVVSQLRRPSRYPVSVHLFFHQSDRLFLWEEKQHMAANNNNNCLEKEKRKNEDFTCSGQHFFLGQTWWYLLKIKILIERQCSKFQGYFSRILCVDHLNSQC